MQPHVESYTQHLEDSGLVQQNSSRQAGKLAAAVYGPKACAQCGTTRTPQWREGPEGPKTLCNACGVKRVRQMRTSSEGGRRKSVKSPVASQRECLNAALTADYSVARDSLQRRPSRKLSGKLAGRAEDGVQHAVWQGEEDEQSCRSSQDTGVADIGDHNSDSAEEVAWVPHRHAQPCQLPPSPTAKAVGQECAAAVDLLSMSVQQEAKQASLAQQRASLGRGCKDSPKIKTASYAQMANSALKWSNHMPAHAEAQDLIQEALAMLPDHKHIEILAVKAELDLASREAAAADAAVAAVAKILAMKQAVSIKARASAAKAAKRIYTFMQDLDIEYGWSQQALKRPRTSQ